MTFGFLTIAQNNSTTDYMRMAYGLALSLHATQKQHKKLSVLITPGTTVPKKYQQVFDQVIDIPYGDESANEDWKLKNEWKTYHCTPYDHTIKLDADMLFFQDLTDTWDVLKQHDMVFCDDVVTYKGTTATSNYYRKTFTENNLPNYYSAFAYFKKSDRALEFFEFVKIITWNWDTFTYEYAPNERATTFSTDVAYGIAGKILGLDDGPLNKRLMFTHMKTHLQPWAKPAMTENWQEYMSVYFTPKLQCKIGNYLQLYPLHYHLKSFLTDTIIEYYEQYLGI